MNKYQKIAFGTVSVLVVAFFLQDQLLRLVLVAGVIALMTLATTWKLVFTGTEVSGYAISFTGHAVGKLGDVVSEGSRNIKAHLMSAPAIPGWNEVTTLAAAYDFDPATVDRSDFAPEEIVSSADDLDVPDFIRDAMDYQNS